MIEFEPFPNARPLEAQVRAAERWVRDPVSALSEATAVRRGLIALVELVLESHQDVLSHVSQDDERAIIENIADVLIDNEWVTGAPE